MRLRLDLIRRNALRFRPALSSMLRYAPNAGAARKCRQVIKLYDVTFGPMSLVDRLKSIAVRVLASREFRRMTKNGPIMRQPPCNRVIYPERSIESPDREYEPADSMPSDETQMQFPVVSLPRR